MVHRRADLTALVRAGDEADDLERERLLAEVERGLFSVASDPPSVGRYEIRERLGGGGQGVVYLAHDPRLDRRVAVKLLRTDARDKPEAHRRLLREASALAQLSHPNVVGVNDVGECPAGIFVVTELVEGLTLGQWLQQSPRTRAEIVGVFLQAGEGLAAAHARGIVHRDFKPANVLVGDDGRVRLLDFGLARGARTEPRADTGARAIEGTTDIRGSGATPDELTASGIGMGTPAYMAPEQWRGAGDARADQFAFAVTLFEALHGRRPFQSHMDGRHFQGYDAVAAFPGDDPHPRWLRHALARALALDPDARHGTMQDLLRALRRGGAAARRTVWIAAGIGVGLLAAALPARDDPCRAVRARMQELWGDERRATLHDALLSSSERSAASIASHVDDELGVWAEAWTGAQRRACEEIFASDDSGRAELDHRLRCLSQRLDAFDALVDVLGGAESSVVAHATEAVARLPRVESCLAEESGEPTPDDPRLRARVDAVRRGLVRVDALHNAGQDPLATEVAQTWLREARRTGYVEVEAEALTRLATALEGVGRYDEAAQRVVEAHDLALASRHDRARAVAAVLAVFIHGHRLADPDAAARWIRHAEAAVATLPQSDELHVLLASNAGSAALRMGDTTEAVRRFQHAVSICAVHCEDLSRALVHNNLAIALVQLGRPADALEHVLKAREIWRARLGVEHPLMAISGGNLTGLLLDLGRPGEALTRAEEALHLHETVHGATHPLAAAAHLNLSAALHRNGRDEESLREARRALELRLAVYGEEHPTVADNHNMLGLALHGLQRHEESVAAYDDAIDIGARVAGPRHPMIGPAMSNSTRPLLALGRTSEALARALDVIELYRAARVPAGDQRFAYAWTSLGLAHLQADDAVAAADALSRALKLRDDGEHDPILRAETRFALARARWAEGERADALALAQAAHAELRGIGAPGPHDRAAIEAWLTAHGPDPR